MSPRVRFLRRLAAAGGVMVGTVLLWLSYCENRNSVSVPPPSKAELQASVERAEQWVSNRQERLLEENNALLWLFVAEAGRATQDDRLLALAGEYQRRHSNGPLVPPAAATNAQIKSAQDRLRWDFRVEDAYIQRVLTLVESGRRRDVKPIWIKRILQSQRQDGGWDGVDIIMPLPEHRWLTWSDGKLYPSIQPRPKSNFHATAQALYLLALLTRDQD